MKKKLKWTCAILGVLAVALGGFFVWFWNSEPTGTSYGGNSAQKEAPPAEVPPFMSVETSKDLLEGFPKHVHGKMGEETFRAEYTGKLVRVKKMLMFDMELYEVGCYIESPKPADTERMLSDMLEDGQRKVYIIKFSKPLPGRSILQAIKNEINETFKDVDMQKVGNDIDRFVKQFAHGSKSNECIYVSWQPGGRLYSSYNAPDKMELISVDVPLSRAIWRIWCGPLAGPERLGMVKHYATPPMDMK